MKLLGWMHRKFRQGTGDTMKEFSLGQQQTLDDFHVYHQKQTQGRQRRSSFMSSVETTKYSSSELEQKISLSSSAEDDFAEYFDGFLAIGTLGNDNNTTVISEPETPTFSVPFEKLKLEEQQQHQQVTENELRLINDELERVFAADESWTDSSGRNSYVSNGRISQASTVTLSGKPLEIPETTSGNNNNNMISCPLQEYLLGAAVEFPDKAASVAAKKEARTSLGELFERQKAEENSQVGFKCKRGDKNGGGGGGGGGGSIASKNLMKKLLNKKKNALNAAAAASKNSARATAESDSKLCKILQKFQKKVHPECLTSTEKSEKMHKRATLNGGYYRDEHTLAEEGNPKSGLNGYMLSRKSISNPTHWEDQDGNDSNGSRECWIKTDADYLVLEL